MSKFTLKTPSHFQKINDTNWVKSQCSFLKTIRF